MDRQTHDSDLIELAIASVETRGSPIKNVDEDVLFLPLALTDD